VIDFGREVCGDLTLSAKREWLVTNGIGGYACGTIPGLLTRRYHGLLVAALKPPLGRTLLVAKVDETAAYDGRIYPLFVNRWASGHVNPADARHLERFHLEGTVPVWTYACADAVLEKRIWMKQGSNTTYIRYDLRRGSAPLTLTVQVLVNYRGHHASTRADTWKMDIQPMMGGLQITAFDGAVPFYLLSDEALCTPERDWHRHFFLAQEAYRGLDAQEDHLHAGTFQRTLQLGESLTIVATTESEAEVDGVRAYSRRRAQEDKLVDQAQRRARPRRRGRQPSLPSGVKHLMLAADQFIVHRQLPDSPRGLSVIAGYPWFGDWGRDTMIALPGLALTTGRPDVAARILRTFARYVDRGMLPNRFPELGEAPEYNTSDATLWYLAAIREYYAATEDNELLRELFPVLQEIIDWHERGTRYGIHVDPDDGLLYAGEEGTQLTWMDAKVGEWVVTPRIGKAVEINALWYNALCAMAEFAARLGEPQQGYKKSAKRVRAGFQRFWNPPAGYCYDVIDGPNGDETALRPNQLLAVALPDSPLESEQQRAVVEVCARRLLTSHGLRSLAVQESAYVGSYGGDQRQRDTAYHQGTVWAWLIGPFVRAHLRVCRDPVLAQSFIQPLIRHLADGCVGTISEVFDGDAPFAPRGCFAQAWSVAEVLRAWQLTEEAKQTKHNGGSPDRATG
jgi:predicted glycogen debranching enzyme